MPTSRKPCSWPGCEELVAKGRCPAHQSKAERQRGSGTDRGSTARWQRFSEWYLATHPLCVGWPTGPCGAKATQPDHIDGCGRNGPRAYDLTNLRPLCKPCHSRRTAHDQPGGWHANR
ncbi:HNH endonuclease [Kibdelosporangium aridum]|uniref:HNH endonuclease n=1 Tax=Kibdelosporangium aridum TaxID=2030 RepID=A0A428YV05_KIBAR|nr:HNH endonuclease [Kibdelosporangium aridum]